MATRNLSVQVPGAQQPPQDADSPTPEAPRDDLPPDLQAIVAAEVERRLALQRNADAKSIAAAIKPGQTVTPYEQAEREQAALPAHRRRAVLTELGWYCPPGMGEQAPKT